MWLRVLLFIFLAYLIIRVVSRIIMPFREVKKGFEEQMRQGQSNSQQKADNRKEGEVRVEEPKKSDSDISSMDGEYVEYEEVD